MPLYEHVCNNPECKDFEVSKEEIRSFSQGRREKCETCDAKLDQVFHGKAPGFLIHGYMFTDPRARRGRFQKERRR